MTRRPGFTALELLITIGVIGILAGVSIPSFAQAQQRLRVRQSAAELADVIRQAQTKAIAGIHGSTITVTFQAGSITTTIDATGTQAVWAIPAGLNIASDVSSVTFNRLTGRPSSPASITVTNDSGNNSAIAVAVSGVITAP